MQVWDVLHAARWKYRTKKWRKKSPCVHHRTTLSSYIFATKAYVDNGKNLLNSNIYSTCPLSMANFGPLTAEIGWRVWGTQANVNGFRVLASLLQRRRSPEANQTLHDLRPSPGLVHYIYIFGGSCPVTEICHVQNSLCVQVLCSPILAALPYCTALQQWASAKLCGVVQGMELRNFHRGRHLCIGWQWRNFFISAVVRHFVGQALLNVCYSDVSKRHFFNKIAIVRTFS